MDFSIRELEVNELDKIKNLWEKLNELHLKDSTYFKEHYQTFTFEKRCKKFESTEQKKIKIQVAETNRLETIGYCIATISEEAGEIDSLFVEEAYRSYGVGKELVENSIKWLKENNCTKIGVSVAQGHESVFSFYEKFGFYPRLTYLQLK